MKLPKGRELFKGRLEKATKLHMSDKVGRINQWSTCLMLASLFFTIIASYPAHRSGSKPTLTYRRPCFAVELGRPPAKRLKFQTRRYHRLGKTAFVRSLSQLPELLIGHSTLTPFSTLCPLFEWWFPLPSPYHRKRAFLLCFFSRTCFGLSFRFGYFELIKLFPLLWN